MASPNGQRGLAVEYLVAWRLVEAGYVVCFPHGSPAYDLVVDTADGLVRLQVKRASVRRAEERRTTPRWAACLLRHGQGGTGATDKAARPYLLSEAGWFAVAMEGCVVIERNTGQAAFYHPEGQTPAGLHLGEFPPPPGAPGSDQPQASPLPLFDEAMA